MADTPQTTDLNIYDVNFNLMQFAGIYNDFIDTTTPKQLKLQFIDESGELKQVTIDNVNIIRSEIKADIDKETQARIMADEQINKVIQDNVTKINDSIAKEIQDRKSEDTKLDTKIDTEVQRAQAEESKLDTKVTNEVNRATEAEKTLDTKIDTEVDRATNVENKIKDDLANEINRAESAEQNLQKEIDTEVNRATEAEKTLDTKIDTEVDRATKVEKTLDEAIKTEVQRATEVEKTLDEAIKAEVNRATEAEGPLVFNDDIRNEDGTLAKNLTNAINIVDDRLNNQAQELKSKDIEIKDYIDTKIENLINGSPDALDTLKELADALGDNPNFAATVTEQLSQVKSNIGDLSKLNTEDKSSLVNALIEVQAEINNEAKIRIAADNTLNDKIVKEAERAESVENELNDKILSEVQRAEDAEKTLGESIKTEVNRATKAESDLDIKINNEIQRAKTAEDELLVDISDEMDRAKFAEGDLEFNDDIVNEDGSKPDNLTDAINDVDRKIEEKFKLIQNQLNLATAETTNEETEADNKDDIVDTKSIKNTLAKLFEK